MAPTDEPAGRFPIRTLQFYRSRPAQANEPDIKLAGGHGQLAVVRPDQEGKQDQGRDSDGAGTHEKQCISLQQSHGRAQLFDDRAGKSLQYLADT